MQTSGYEGSQFPCQSAKGIAFVSNTLTNDQFINSSFEELENLGRKRPLHTPVIFLKTKNRIWNSYEPI